MGIGMARFCELGLSTSAEIYQDAKLEFIAHEVTYLRLSKTQNLLKRTREVVEILQQGADMEEGTNEKVRKLVDTQQETRQKRNDAEFQLQLEEKTYLPVQ